MDQGVTMLGALSFLVCSFAPPPLRIPSSAGAPRWCANGCSRSADVAKRQTELQPPRPCPELLAPCLLCVGVSSASSCPAIRLPCPAPRSSWLALTLLSESPLRATPSFP